MIKKNNIKKYAGITILSAALIAGTALNIHNNTTNHIDEECNLCKKLQFATSINGEIGTLGIIHQMHEINSYYKELDENVSVRYEANHVDYVDNITPLIEVPMLDGTIKYNVSGEFEIVEIDGKKYAVTRVPEGEPYPAIITEHLNDNDEIMEEDIMKLGK